MRQWCKQILSARHQQTRVTWGFFALQKYAELSESACGQGKENCLSSQAT